MITPDDGGDGYDQYDGGQIPDFSSDSYYKSGACKTRRELTFFFFMDDSWGFSISFPKKKNGKQDLVQRPRRSICKWRTPWRSIPFRCSRSSYVYV